MLNPLLVMEVVGLVLRRRYHQDRTTPFISALEPPGGNRVFVLTRERRVGWVNKECQPRDRVVIVYGCTVPFVERGCEGAGGWQGNVPLRSYGWGAF